MSNLERDWGNRIFIASFYPEIKSVAGSDCKLIDHMVSQRNRVEWVGEPRGEQYKEEAKQEGFLEFRLPQVQKEFKEMNDIIREASDRILRRLMAFEKAGLAEFAELGYEAKLGKFSPSMSGALDWADYDFKQDVMVKDKVFGHSDVRHLTWGFRSYMTLSDDSGWTHFAADTGTDATRTFAEMVLIMRERQHAWGPFVDWRKKRMAEKGIV